VEQPSALGGVITVISGFPKASQDRFIYSLLPVIATLFYFDYSLNSPNSPLAAYITWSIHAPGSRRKDFYPQPKLVLIYRR